MNVDYEVHISTEVESDSSSDSKTDTVAKNTRQGVSKVFVMPSEINSELLEIAPGEGKTPTSNSVRNRFS